MCVCERVCVCVCARELMCVSVRVSVSKFMPSRLLF